MKLYGFILFLLIMIASCQSEQTEAAHVPPTTDITFIADYNDAETEVTIRKMIRHSIVEDQYTLLNHNDTTVFESEGKTFFTVGIRATFLDTVIVESGDIVTVSISNNSLRISTTKSDLATNLQWITNYHKQVEDAYQILFEPITDHLVDLTFLKTPLINVNDYQKFKFYYTHLYEIDRNKYNLNKSEIDQQLQNKYLEFDSLITTSAIDIGSKQIMRDALDKVTFDKFRRMGSTVQDWMFDKINQDIEKDCSSGINTKRSEFYWNYLTDKFFQKITYRDLDIAFQKTHELACPKFRQEIQRVGLLKMFSNGNQISKTKNLFTDFVSLNKDSSFQKLIDERFGLSDFVLDGKEMNNALVDIQNKNFDYDDLIKESAGNIILVDFWASWCGPCRVGMPDVKRLEEKYENDNFKVIYISIDKHPAQWKKAAKDEEIWDRNNYWAYNFNDSEIRERFQLTHIPRYIIYDKSGNVVYQQAPKPADMEDIIVDLLDL